MDMWAVSESIPQLPLYSRINEVPQFPGKRPMMLEIVHLPLFRPMSRRLVREIVYRYVGGIGINSRNYHFMEELLSRTANTSAR